MSNTTMQHPTVYVVTRHGACEGVFSHIPALQDVRVVVVDADNHKADPDGYEDGSMAEHPVEPFEEMPDWAQQIVQEVY